MTDVIINELKQAIGKRKSDIGLIRKQLQKINPTLQICHKTIGEFYVKKNNVHIIGEFYIYRDSDCNEVCYIGMGDSEARIKPMESWFNDFCDSIDTYLTNIEAEKQRNQFNELLATARSLGIDTTPYEAEGVGSEDGRED
jgi:hypothetical protein